jgi:hypothetical protein
MNDCSDLRVAVLFCAHGGRRLSGCRECSLAVLGIEYRYLLNGKFWPEVRVTGTVMLPPALGYGSKGVEGVIPPDARMIFVIDVMSIEKSPD